MSACGRHGPASMDELLHEALAAGAGVGLRHYPSDNRVLDFRLQLAAFLREMPEDVTVMQLREELDG